MSRARHIPYASLATELSQVTAMVCPRWRRLNFPMTAVAFLPVADRFLHTVVPVEGSDPLSGGGLGEPELIAL